MKPSKPVIIVSLLAGVLAVVQSACGLFIQTPGEPWTFTNLHNRAVEITGHGLYAFDAAFRAPVFRGTDAVTLFLAVPLLAAALYFYSRGLARGRLLLTGVLAYLLYNAASVALGVAYNNLFLVYIAYFSSSLFALGLVVFSFDLQDLAARVAPTVPHKRIAALMFFSAVGLLFAWLPTIVVGLVQNQVPDIASYTTEVTDVLDLGIIVPLCTLAGFSVLRRKPSGYLLSSTLMILLVIVGVLVTVQTLFQQQAGINLPLPAFIAMAGSFMVLSLFAIWLVVLLFRGISEAETPRGVARRAVKARA